MTRYSSPGGNEFYHQHAGRKLANQGGGGKSGCRLLFILMATIAAVPVVWVGSAILRYAAELLAGVA